MPICVSVNPRVMVMKGYSTFHKAPELKFHHQIQFCVITRIIRVLPLCKGDISEIYNPSQQGDVQYEEATKILHSRYDRNNQFFWILVASMLQDIISSRDIRWDFYFYPKPISFLRIKTEKNLRVLCIKLHLIARLQLRGFGECEVCLHFHYSKAD